MTEFEFVYRKISDFEFIWSKAHQYRIWLCHCWKMNMCGVWINYGIRICGWELSWKRYFTLNEQIEQRRNHDNV